MDHWIELLMWVLKNVSLCIAIPILLIIATFWYVLWTRRNWPCVVIRQYPNPKNICCIQFPCGGQALSNRTVEFVVSSSAPFSADHDYVLSGWDSNVEPGEVIPWRKDLAKGAPHLTTKQKFTISFLKEKTPQIGFYSSDPDATWWIRPVNSEAMFLLSPITIRIDVRYEFTPYRKKGTSIKTVFDTCTYSRSYLPGK